MSTTLDSVLTGAKHLVSKELAYELREQGHYLTGALEAGLGGQVDGEVLEGTAPYYLAYLDEGVKAASASFKQFPFVVAYFQQRGLSEAEAKRAAAATIKKWMVEGMPTSASYAHATNARRKEAVSHAFTAVEPVLDRYMDDGLTAFLDEAADNQNEEI